MTRVIPQIVNTKTTLRAAVQALPDTVKVQALLGLDGDCDFSLRTSESYPFRCTKEDLLSLIDRQVHEATVLACLEAALILYLLLYHYQRLPSITEKSVVRVISC